MKLKSEIILELNENVNNASKWVDDRRKGQDQIDKTINTHLDKQIKKEKTHLSIMIQGIPKDKSKEVFDILKKHKGSKFNWDSRGGNVVSGELAIKPPYAEGTFDKLSREIRKEINDKIGIYTSPVIYPD